MTIVEAPQELNAVYSGRSRTVAATALVVGPTLMLAAFLASAWAERSAPGAGDLAIAVAAPTATGIGSLFDLLSVPAMLAVTVVLFQVTRRWSPRAARVGTVAMVLQLCGLAAVVGVELLSALLAQHGVDQALIDDISNNALPSTVPGLALFIMFLPTELIGLIAFGIALWRTRWVPRLVPVLLWLFPIVDLGAPDQPAILHVVGFAIFLAGFIALARAVRNTGATLPTA